MKKNKYGFLGFLMIHFTIMMELLKFNIFESCGGCISANIALDCDNPRLVGYEDTAVIACRDDIDFANSTADATTKQILTSIILKTGKKWSVIYNPRTTPAAFDGTTTEYDPETDTYTKTLQFYYQGIGGDASNRVIEPLKNGNYVAILQRKDHRGDGSFPVIGWQSGLRVTAQVQDEATGYWLVTMQETYAPSAEMAFFSTDYPTTVELFDAMKANSY